MAARHWMRNPRDLPHGRERPSHGKSRLSLGQSYKGNMCESERIRRWQYEAITTVRGRLTLITVGVMMVDCNLVRYWYTGGLREEPCSTS